MFTRAVVTGASSGLGRAFCVELARKHGAKIIVADINMDGAKETIELVKSAGGEGTFVECDVTVAEHVQHLRKKVEEVWGSVDLLVNNAGVAVGGFIGDIPLSDWEWILNINLKGAIHGCHFFVPLFKKQGRGTILNVASGAGIASFPEMGPYNVVKAGVISLSETLFAELRAHNIHVTVLCPSFFKTNILKSFRSPDARQGEMAQAFFDKTKITAEDVARIGLRAAERKRLYAIPQADAKFVWFVKRLMPEVYFKISARLYNNGMVDKWLKKNQ